MRGVQSLLVFSTDKMSGISKSEQTKNELMVEVEAKKNSWWVP